MTARSCDGRLKQQSDKRNYNRVKWLAHEKALQSFQRNTTSQHIISVPRVGQIANNVDPRTRSMQVAGPHLTTARGEREGEFVKCALRQPIRSERCVNQRYESVVVCQQTPAARFVGQILSTLLLPSSSFDVAKLKEAQSDIEDQSYQGGNLPLSFLQGKQESIVRSREPGRPRSPAPIKSS